ncbi:MAG TPA: type I glyceraldehyde-3-phosphate dehydrogenase, partial [Campylobacterales bacterium]|nr:type I glyceraldehyde-3-phosphate dehydrogenase [Campylobacterales bacterium]
FKEASQNGYKGLVEYDEDMRVSSDFIGSTFSAIFVPDSTQVVDGDMVKVVAWYDNEWGYTSRLVDMAKYIGG